MSIVSAVNIEEWSNFVGQFQKWSNFGQQLESCAERWRHQSESGPQTEKWIPVGFLTSLDIYFSLGTGDP